MRFREVGEKNPPLAACVLQDADAHVAQIYTDLEPVVPNTEPWMSKFWLNHRNGPH